MNECDGCQTLLLSEPSSGYKFSKKFQFLLITSANDIPTWQLQDQGRDCNVLMLFLYQISNFSIT